MSKEFRTQSAPAPSPVVEYARTSHPAFHQPRGNGARQEQVFPEVPELATNTPSADGWVPAYGPGSYDTPDSKILEPSASLDSGTHTGALSASGVSGAVGRTTTGEDDASDDLFGTDRQTTQGTASLGADGTGSFGLRHAKEVGIADGKAALTLSGSANVTTDGVVNASLQGGVEGAKGAVAGMVDVDAEGIGAVGASVSAEAGGVGASLGAHVQLGTVKRDGNRITLASGHGVDASAEAVGVGGGHSFTHGSEDSLDFASEADAKAYEQKLLEGKGKSNQDLSAAEIAEMPENTRIAYIDASKEEIQGKFVVGLAAADSSVRGVTIDRMKGSELSLRVTSEDRSGLTGSATGPGSVSGSREDVQENEAVYTVDLSDPVQQAAFDHFQETGDASGLTQKMRKEMDGAENGLGGSIPGLEIGQTWGTSTGFKEEDGERELLDKGISGDEVGTWGAAEVIDGMAAGMNGWEKIGMMPEGAGAGWSKVADWWRGDARDQNGTTRHESLVRSPEEGPQTMEIHSAWDLDDQQELSRQLQDHATPDIDEREVDPALLADQKPIDQTWELDCMVGPEGTERMKDRMVNEGTYDTELSAQKTAGPIFRDAREQVAAGADPDRVFAEGVPQWTAVGGQDVAEELSQISPEDTECFLKSEGTGFIGREAHESQAKKVEELKLAAMEGDETAWADLDAIVEAAFDREDRLQDHPVPQRYIDEERRRIETLATGVAAVRP